MAPEAVIQTARLKVASGGGFPQRCGPQAQTGAVCRTGRGMSGQGKAARHRLRGRVRRQQRHLRNRSRRAQTRRAFEAFSRGVRIQIAGVRGPAEEAYSGGGSICIIESGVIQRVDGIGHAAAQTRKHG